MRSVLNGSYSIYRTYAVRWLMLRKASLSSFHLSNDKRNILCVSRSPDLETKMTLCKVLWPLDWKSETWNYLCRRFTKRTTVAYVNFYDSPPFAKTYT